MTELRQNPAYREDVAYVANLALPWEKLEGRTFLISGATGLIGSFLVDVLLYRNQHCGAHCTIYALGRNAARARERFPYGGEALRFIPCDINAPFPHQSVGAVDYVLHLASNTHPVAYATDPIGTILTNLTGTAHMLEAALAHGAARCLFASSNEVYGENRGDTELFAEDYCGYIDCNTLRAGYPESKRCGEALCQAYIRQKHMDIVIPRFTRSYGPTMLPGDTKAISQFIRKAAAGEDIVLKSQGTQYYSYTYVADAVSGLLTVLLCGKSGEAYNIADAASDITLRELAGIIAECAGTKVVFALPDAVERAGYSTATKARLDGTKLKKLHWEAKYDIASGIARTIAILREAKEPI
jgi:nucleoside-diphosphate-sugar epimerase